MLLLEGEALKLLLAVGRFPGGVVVVAVLSPAFVAVAFAEKEDVFFFSSLVSSCLLCRPRDKEAAFVFPAAAVVAAVGEEPFSAPFAFVVVEEEEDIADADIDLLPLLLLLAAADFFAPEAVSTAEGISTSPAVVALPALDFSFACLTSRSANSAALSVLLLLLLLLLEPPDLKPMARQQQLPMELSTAASFTSIKYTRSWQATIAPKSPTITVVRPRAAMAMAKAVIFAWSVSGSLSVRGSEMPHT